MGGKLKAMANFVTAAAAIIEAIKKARKSEGK